MTETPRPAAFDAWATAGLVEVTLPSGFRIRGVVPARDEILRRGVAPRAARHAVLQLEQPGDPAGDADPDATSLFLATLRDMAAAFVRDVWDAASQEWIGVPRMTGEDLDRHAFDPRDIEALERIVTFAATPEQVTAESGGARPIAEEAGPAQAWAEFRDDAGGDRGGADGGAVLDPAVDAPGDH